MNIREITTQDSDAIVTVGLTSIGNSYNNYNPHGSGFPLIVVYTTNFVFHTVWLDLAPDLASLTLTHTR